MVLEVVRRNNNILICRIAGGISAADRAALMRLCIDEAALGRKIIVLSLSDFSEINASGLRTFWDAFRLGYAQGGNVVLAGLNKPVKETLELTRLNRLFDIFETEEEAVAALEAGLGSRI